MPFPQNICKRNNIPKLLWKADKSLLGKVDRQNISVHRWYAAKACPGDYLYVRLGEVADEVNKILMPSPIVPPVVPVGFPYMIKSQYGRSPLQKWAGNELSNSRPGQKGRIIHNCRRSLRCWIVKNGGRLKSGAGWIALDYCVKVR